MLGVLIPEHLGWLEAIFLSLLLTLVGLVGAFALYVIVQQFRNPGRPVRR
jgi:cytoskeletal protein RodZ